MHELSRISAADLQLQDEASAPLSSEALILASALTPPVSDENFATLQQLMQLTQARFPNQELAPGTPDMYLAEWEEMVSRFGLTEFRESLGCVIRDRERAPFFPAPEEIEATIRAHRHSKRERQKTLDEFAALEMAKAQWQRERDEEKVHGRQYTEAELALDVKLKALAGRRGKKPPSVGA